MKQKVVENISKISTPIILIIDMHIRPTKLLEVSPSNARYNLERKLREGCTGADWDNNGKIEEAMPANDDKDNDEENL